VIVQSIMVDIVSHKAPLDRLTSVSRKLQLNDASVSTVAAQITNRYRNILSKVIFKPS